jgi:hypothetical protein
MADPMEGVIDPAFVFGEKPGLRELTHLESSAKGVLEIILQE